MNIYNSLYKIINILLGNLLLRYVKTKYAIAIMKRLSLDVRYCWDFERLYFLNKDSFYMKTSLLKAYYFFTPVGYGVTWGCAMESAYRIINISHAEIVSKKKIDYIRIERNFILNNLEAHSNNNHYFFNIIGILISNTVLNIEEGDEQWVNLFLNECKNQFNNDGTNFEASSNYHLVMLEAICHLIKVRPDFLSIALSNINVEGAIKFINLIETNNGILLIGDNDDGHCLKKHMSEKRNRIDQINFIKAHLKHKTLDTANRTYFYPDFGAVFFAENDCCLSIWNPSNGQDGKSGHNHNDNHTVCCLIEGKEFIIDSGVFYYSLKRDYFRNCDAHSSIIPLGFNYNKFLGRFSRSVLGISNVEFCEDSVRTIFKLNNQYTERVIKRVGDKYLFEDCCSESTSISAQIILSNEVDVSINNGIIILSRNDCNKKINILTELDSNISIKEIIIAPYYSQYKISKKIIISSLLNRLKWEVEIK